MNRVQRYRNTPKGYLTNMYHKQITRNESRGHGPLPYTLQEFQEWALAQQLYHELFEAYLEAEKDINLAPSFDRDDNSKGYSFDNMTLMTWEKNNAKDRSTHRSIKVEQWSKDRATLIATYDSAVEADKATPAHRSKISEVCNGTRKSAGGYWWKFKN